MSSVIILKDNALVPYIHLSSQNNLPLIIDHHPLAVEPAYQL